jgi:hypothetical protein
MSFQCLPGELLRERSEFGKIVRQKFATSVAVCLGVAEMRRISDWPETPFDLSA